jgi:cellulose synthase/poly-beta-1,6-N-acetylglucosamine synthase-like glycosyltransferase
MVTCFAVLLLCLSAGYAVILLWIRAGLRRISRQFSDEQPRVSVVIAARNEAANIPALLQALTAQDYPADRSEILIIDDQSEDDTAALVRNCQDSRVRLLQTTNRRQVISPKKNALHLGIKNASGEIILLTDADCLPPVGWISGIVRRFTSDVGMVIGFSPCELPELRQFADYLLALESLSLAAVAAGTSGWAFAATCNGRNLAYRRRVFEEVGGFTPIQRFLSGDDDLFLRLVQNTSWHIRFAYDPSLVVPTQRLESMRRFVHQRLRHASKGFSYSAKKVFALVIVYFYNVLIMAAPVIALLNGSGLTVPLLAITVKIGADYLLLHRFAAHMQRQSFLRVFLPGEMMHIPYVVIFGALGPFIKAKWKEPSTGSHA